MHENTYDLMSPYFYIYFSPIASESSNTTMDTLVTGVVKTVRFYDEIGLMQPFRQSIRAGTLGGHCLRHEHFTITEHYRKYYASTPYHRQHLTLCHYTSFVQKYCVLIIFILCPITAERELIRIVDGGTPLQGRTEFYNEDKWGTICNNE